MSKTPVLIAARMGSSRLPGKVLADLDGQPVLRWAVERASRARGTSGVAVLTTISPEDDPIIEACTGWGVRCLRGAVDDVYERHREAAALLGASSLVRATADNPFVSSETIEALLARHEAGHAALTTTRELRGAEIVRRTLPAGLSVDVIDARALASAPPTPSRATREHVIPIFFEGRVGLGAEVVSFGLSQEALGIHLSIDEPTDLARARRLAPRMRETDLLDEIVAIALGDSDVRPVCNREAG